MRIFLFLLSLIIVVCSAVLAYLGFNETLPFVYYMLSSTALSAVLALLLGHFMYRTYANRKRARDAERLSVALENEKRELAAQRNQLETQLTRKGDTVIPPLNMDPDLTQKITMTPPKA
ncbi:MAG: hypothetical protein E7A50_00690 [Clostridiales bacterium]|nr:hypothetical protein [Clostridiales bacterium]MDU1027997.1 hypothetical protein [Clostridiales bacterium]